MGRWKATGCAVILAVAAGAAATADTGRCGPAKR